MTHVSDLEHLRLDAAVYPDCIVEVHRVSNVARGLRKVPITKIWRTQKSLGRGAFGEVQLQVQDSDPNLKRAVKVIPTIGGMSTSDYERELTALIEFSKPKYKDEAVFVQFLGWFQTNDAIFLAMEYIPLGDLENNLQDLEKSRHMGRDTGGYGSGVLSRIEVRDIITQILEGIKMMHAEGFAHRDLKPQNVLVAQREPTWWVKLGDFGLSKRRTESTAYHSHAGTQSYMAPEMFHYVPGLNPDSSEYTNAVDIWALGCIMYRILTGRPPFPELWSLQRYCSKSSLPMFLGGLSEVETEAEIFVRQLLAPHPGERLSAWTALGHPWLSVSTQAAVVGESQVDQRSAHPILADAAHKPIFKDTGPPPPYFDDGQSQYNYNTASHAGLRSRHQSGGSQDSIVKQALVNQWPEADRVRMREPMPKAFELERFDAPNQFEDSTSIAKKVKLKAKDEAIDKEQEVQEFTTWEDLNTSKGQLDATPVMPQEMPSKPGFLRRLGVFKGLRSFAPILSSQRGLKAETPHTKTQHIDLRDEAPSEQLARDTDGSIFGKSPLAITPSYGLPAPYLARTSAFGVTSQQKRDGAFSIHIHTFTGYRFQLQVHPLNRVLTVKRKLSQTKGLPTEGLLVRGFRLHFEDRLLEDDYSLVSYGIEAGSLIRCRWTS